MGGIGGRCGGESEMPFFVFDWDWRTVERESR